MSLHDDLLKHQIFVQRLIGTEIKSIKESLDLLRRRAISGASNGIYGAALKNLLRKAISGLPDTAISNMVDIATYESKFSAEMFAKYFSQSSIKNEPTSAMIALNLDDTKEELKILKEAFGDAKQFLGSYKGSLETSYEVPINGTKKLLEIARKYNQESTLLLTKDKGAQLLFTKDKSKVALGTFTKVGKEQPSTESWTKDVKTGQYYVTKEIAPVNSAALDKLLRTKNMSINYLVGGQKAPKKSLETAYKQFSQRKADDITQVITDARLSNLSKLDIEAAIHERINGLITTQSSTLAQTAINYTTNVARMATMEANPEVPDNVLWTADLEVNEHCSECEELDGNVYARSEIEEPPLHWGCLCSIEPTEDKPS